MRIGLDANSGIHTINKQWKGYSRYVWNLLKYMGQEDNENEYFVYSIKDWDFPSMKKNNFHKVNQPPGFISRLWDSFDGSHGRRVLHISYSNLMLPKYLKRDDIDVFHSALFVLPHFKTCKQVVTIHDPYVNFSFEYLRKYPYTPIFKLLTRYAIKRADKIITISESTKNFLLKFYKISPDKISVVYLSADSFFKPISEDQAKNMIKLKYNLLGDFILNLTAGMDLTLLKAFYALKKNYDISNKLVIIGDPPPNFINEIRNLKLVNDVVLLRYVSDKDLVCFYNAADLFVYPSTSEGFGFPPLEAMACGTPVIADDIDSIPEVVGDAGILVKSFAVNELAHAMFTVLTDETLRSNLKNKGLRRSKLFSWTRMARETINIYQEMMKR
jgi:glycosyltransferase involved in cell wall biosynthesis